MPRFRLPHAWWPLVFAALAVAPCRGDADTTRNFSIATEPSGAAVWVMGEKVGTTPLQLRERTIYPNDFPDDKAHLYGTITLRRDDCDTQLYRVNETDIRNGLRIEMDCRPGTAPDSLESRQEPGSRVSSTPVSGEETISERKLRQLRVLQELFDEGVITAEEERRLRRRIFGVP